MIFRPNILLRANANSMCQFSFKCFLESLCEEWPFAPLINRVFEKVLGLMRKLFVTVNLLFILLGGCAQLPEYARPLIITHKQELAQLDGFGYRQLTRNDFKATSPFFDSTEQNSHLQARSCIKIIPASDIKVDIVQGMIHGKEVFAGKARKVRFEARFLPHCSWWNPKVSVKRSAYVLQHEQIHFAIAELEARKLGHRVDGEMPEYFAFGDNVEEVQQELSKTIQKDTQKSTQDGLEEHLKFDNETSMFFAPYVQQKWLEKVESKLAEYQ